MANKQIGPSSSAPATIQQRDPTSLFVVLASPATQNPPPRAIAYRIPPRLPIRATGQITTTEMGLARIVEQGDIYEAGTEPERAYKRAVAIMGSIWSDEQFGDNMDLPGLIGDEDINEESGRKRQRASTNATIADLGKWSNEI